MSPARSTMGDGNKNGDWHVFESLYYRLLSHYKSVLKQHHNTHIIKEIKGKVVKLIDSSTISLCLAMFLQYFGEVRLFIILVPFGLSEFPIYFLIFY